MATPERPVYYDPAANTISGNSLGDVLDAWDSRTYQTVTPARRTRDPLLSFGKMLCEAGAVQEQHAVTPIESEGV